MVTQPSAYLLLLLYLTVVFKPLVPLAQDFWEHTFNEAEHLATVHEHSGSHHLQKELAEQDEDHDHDHNDHNLKADDEVLLHLIVTVFTVDFGLKKTNAGQPLYTPSQLALVILSSPSPPPKKQYVIG